MLPQFINEYLAMKMYAATSYPCCTYNVNLYDLRSKIYP